MTRLPPTSRGLWLALAGCGLLACDDACGPGRTEDSALTVLHRAALPRLPWLEMPAPGDAAAAGEASFPTRLNEAAALNNWLLESHLALLELMADRPPAQQDADSQLSTWGPFDDESTPFVQDELLLRVRSAGAAATGGEDGGAADSAAHDAASPGPEADFAVLYTLSRRHDGDADSEQIVLWGGTRRVHSDNPEGALVWDFDANRRWDARYNPVQQRLDQGHLAMAFADLPAADASGTSQHLVAVAWREVVLRQADSGTPPFDAAQRWGHGRRDGTPLRFVALHGPAQLDEDTASQVEVLEAASTFGDDGAGRASYTARSGDIPAGFRVEGEECWSASGALRFASATLLHEPGYLPPSPLREPTGSAVACRPAVPWTIPTTTDLPPALATWLERGSTQGAAAITPLHER